MSGGAATAMDHDGIQDRRNRRLVRLLLTIVAILIVGSFLVGIRW
jgi:hypothetical protein